MTTEEARSAVLDLAPNHEKLTNLFPEPTPEEVERHSLSADQLAFWEENGYLPGVQILNEAQIEALRAELKTIMEPDNPGRELFHEYHLNESGDPDNVLFHALGAWRAAPGFHDLLWNPPFTVPARQLLGGSVRFWHDQLFCKPPMHGGVVAWHQDYSYWTRTQPMAHLTCWIGLDDATRENGCIAYIPGSHRWTLLPITGLAGDMAAINAVLNEEQRAQFAKPAFVELKAGQGVFHHPLTVHGSDRNRTDRPRRAVVLNAFRDGVTSDSETPLLKGVPVFKKGEPLGGDFFPLLLK